MPQTAKLYRFHDTFTITRSMEVRRLPTYARYIAGGPGPVVAFLGARVALVVDVATAGAEVDAMAGEWAPATAVVVGIIEQLVALYESVTGWTPPCPAPLEGRMRVEVAHLPNAAGLAHHGALGFAMGPAFLASMLAGARAGAPCVHHVVGYELLRNFIDPTRFTTAVDYVCARGQCPTPRAAGVPCEPDADCWGWVNQGFVDVVGCLLADQLRAPGGGAPVAFDYFGHDRRGFRAMMEAHVGRYRRGEAQGDALAPALAAAGSPAAPPLAWESVFLHERTPWDAGSSLDNVYAGILSELYERHGPGLLAGFFRAVPLLLDNGRAPPSKRDWATAAENFALAASVGAGCDLEGYFRGLRWPLRDGVLGPGGLVHLLLAADGAG